MRRTFVLWLSSLLAVPAFLVMTSSPAAASATTCDPGELCVWSGVYAGAFDQVAQANLAHDPDLANNTYDTDRSRTQNNTISSIWNRTNKYVRLFDGKNYGSAMVCVGPGVAIDLSKPFNPGNPIWGDRTSSYRVGTCAS